jgi:hypothetical protein
MKEAKVVHKGNNSRACNAVVTLKDVAVNKKQNKMDVVVGKVPWHYQDSEKDYKEISGTRKTLWSGRTNDVKR